MVHGLGDQCLDQVTVIKNPAEIDWTRKTEKRRNDFLLRELCGPALLQYQAPAVLSFPAAGWLWERAVIDMFDGLQNPPGIEFIGLETNQTVFADSCQTATKLRAQHPEHQFNVSCKDACDFIKDTNINFDVIYLDWMGTWAKSKRETLATIAKRELLNPGGMLIFTLALTRRRISNAELAEYAGGEHNFVFLDSRIRRENLAETSGTHFVGKGIAGLVMSLFEDAGQTLTPLLGKIYYDISGRTPRPEIVLCFEKKQ